MLPRPKRLKIINHKVNKTMHSTVLSERLLCCLHVLLETSYFPLMKSWLRAHCILFCLKITLNSGFWMLMLSLNNFIGSVYVSDPAGLGPPSSHWLRHVMTPIPSHYWSTSHPSCDLWFVCMWILSQWTIDFQNNNNNEKTALMRDKIIVAVN